MAVSRFDLPVIPTSPGEPVIRMRGITKVFHSAAGEATVLKCIDVDIRQGEFVSVDGLRDTHDSLGKSPPTASA